MQNHCLQQQQFIQLDKMQETGWVGRPSDEVPALIFLIFDIRGKTR